MTDIPSGPLTGTNFYIQALLLIASLFGGMTDDTAHTVVAAGAGIVAAFFALRNWLVGKKFTTGKSWLADPNNWSYLASVIVAVLPSASAILPPLRGLVDALVSGNWGAIITGGVAFLSILYYTFFKKKTPVPA